MAGFVGSGSTTTLGTGAGTGGTSLSVSKTGCTAGNLLIVEFSLWRSTNTDAGTMSASGWTTGPQQVESASSRVRTGWLFLPNCGSGTQSASLSWANSADCTARIHEYSGMGAATLDGTNGNSSSNSPFGTGNATSVSTGELAFDVIADDGANVTYTISDGKNSRGGQNPSSSVPALLGGDLLSTSGTTNSGAWTSSPTNVPGNAVYAIGVLLPGPTGGASIGIIQPGPTWRRQFWLGLEHPFLGAPSSAGPVTTPITLSVATTSAVVLTKQVAKPLSVATSSAVTLLKTVGKVLSVATSSAVSLAAIKTKLVTLSVATSSAVSLTKQVGKTLSVSTSNSASLVKQVGKVLSVATISSVSLLKQIAKTLSVAATSSVTLQAIRTKLVTLSVATSSSVSMVRLVGKNLAVATTSQVSIRRSIGKVLSVATAPAASMVKGITKTLVQATVSVATLAAANITTAVKPVAPPVTVVLMQAGRAVIGLFGSRSKAQPQEGRDDVEPQ